MSWIPTFLNPGAAILAGALAIPALLILYFLKLRRREVPISSTLLWKKAIQDLQVNAPFQKLRRNLLLLLQLLFLILLLLALARPVVNMTPGAGKMAVLLIDRSASMQARDADGRTRLEVAKARARDLVGTLERGASAMVIAFDDRAEAIQPFTTDASALRRAIDSIEPTDRRSRLKLAYQLAEAQANFNPEQLRSSVKPDVWVFSDGRVLDADELRITGEVKYEPLGSSETSNVGIVALSARRNYERPTEVQVFARLANFGPEVVEPDVQLSIAMIDPQDPANLRFQLTRVAETTLLPQRWTAEQRDAAERQGIVPRDSVEFTVELTTAAVIRIEQMARQNDALPADDVAQVVVPPPKALRVALVTEGNYWLEKAMASLNLRDSATIAPQAYEASFSDEANHPRQFDVIVFDRYAPADRSLLPEAGNFVWMGAAPPWLKVRMVEEGGEPIVIDGVDVLDWQREHPILRGLVMSRIEVHSAYRLEVPPEAERLVEGIHGPLIVLHREGRATHLVVGFDPLTQSLWPLRASFPMFMQQSMQYLAVGSEMNVREAHQPGATPRIPRPALERALAGRDRLRLNGPMGSREIVVPAAGDFALPPLDAVGIYTLDPPVPQYEQIAVNLLDENESNLVPVTVAPGNIGQTIDQAAGRSRLDLWWWIIACAALPLLLIEWWVYTRRVHL